MKAMTTITKEQTLDAISGLAEYWGDDERMRPVMEAIRSRLADYDALKAEVERLKAVVEDLAQTADEWAEIAEKRGGGEKCLVHE